MSARPLCSRRLVCSSVGPTAVTRHDDKSATAHAAQPRRGNSVCVVQFIRRGAFTWQNMPRRMGTNSHSAGPYFGFALGPPLPRQTIAGGGGIISRLFAVFEIASDSKFQQPASCVFSFKWPPQPTPHLPVAALSGLAHGRPCPPLGGLAHGPATNERRRTTTRDDEKMLRAHTGTKPKTPIDGACENLVVAPATGPRCARGPLPSSSMRAWLEQPHGRRHKAPPQPCALNTTASSCFLGPGNRRCLQ